MSGTPMVVLTNDDLGADKILTEAATNGLYQNGLQADSDANNDAGSTTTYNSGTNTWNKPAGYADTDTVLIRVWGGGGGGGRAVGSGGGGGGGGFCEVAYRYSAIPATLNCVVGAGGAGGATGASGGDSIVSGSGVYVAALGGVGGASAAGAGGKMAVASGSGVDVVMAITAYTGGSGGGSGGSGFAAWWGGGGGGGHNAGGPGYAGGTSRFGGAGGQGGGNSVQTGVAGTAPGGGGGMGSGSANAGAGAAGRITIKVVSGWHPTILSDGL